MSEPSEPIRERPDRVGSETPAPLWLRRRVLARVRAEPELIGPGALSALRRLLTGRGRRGALAALAAGTAVATLFATLGSKTDPGPGRVWLAESLGSAHAGLRRAGTHAELRLEGMPRPPVGEVYEVWLAGARSKPRPTDALFNVTSAGTAAVEVPGSLIGVRRVTVTAEPLGGSRHPTGPVIVAMRLADDR